MPLVVRRFNVSLLKIALRVGALKNLQPSALPYIILLSPSRPSMYSDFQLAAAVLANVSS